MQLEDVWSNRLLMSSSKPMIPSDFMTCVNVNLDIYHSKHKPSVLVACVTAKIENDNGLCRRMLLGVV